MYYTYKLLSRLSSDQSVLNMSLLVILLTGTLLVLIWRWRAKQKEVDYEASGIFTIKPTWKEKLDTLMMKHSLIDSTRRIYDKFKGHE